LREVLMLAEITGVHKDVLSTTLWSDETVTACLVESHDLARHSHHSTTQSAADIVANVILPSRLQPST
jgi:hypothetical protein